MEEQFEYGEEVEVIDNDTNARYKRSYVSTVTTKEGKKLHFTVMPGWSEELAIGKGTIGWVQPYYQIRKIQKPEPELIDIEQPETIEQRMDKFEAVFNGAVKHINEHLESIKTQLK